MTNSDTQSQVQSQHMISKNMALHLRYSIVSRVYLWELTTLTLTHNNIHSVLSTILLIHRAYDTLQINLLEEDKIKKKKIQRTFLTRKGGAWV